MKYFNLLVLSLLLFSSCKETSKELSANDIINKSIEISGGDKFGNSVIEFDFRNRHYKATRNNGVFKLERSFKDSIYTFNDVLTNNNFKRFINGEEFKIVDSMIPRYASSVNSVHYFSVLPYGLNDAAVNKFYLGKDSLKGKEYYKVRVTFDEQGGGEDFDDIFIYWIDTKTFKNDYLAYTYEEDHGDGFRFREAYNERNVEGLRFVDYNNYKPKNNNVSITDLDKLFEEGQLELLSIIKTENVKVH